MILYTPHSDPEAIRSLFPEVVFENTSLYGAYTAEDDHGNPVKCLIKIDGRFCEILAVNTDYTDKLLTEGLIRAALHYAGNRNAYIARCGDEKISDVLLLLGFKKNGAKAAYEGEIPELLAGSCCKH